MPLVKPRDKEKREDFMSRCMSDDKTTSEYPKATQRLAVCSTQYENSKKEKYTMSDIEKMGEAIKTLTDVISAKENKPKAIPSFQIKLKFKKDVILIPYCS